MNVWETRRRSQGSKAYAKALAKAGVLTTEEAQSITEGLSAVAEEWRSGSFEIKAGDEASVAGWGVSGMPPSLIIAASAAQELFAGRWLSLTDVAGPTGHPHCK